MWHANATINPSPTGVVSQDWQHRKEAYWCIISFYRQYIFLLKSSLFEGLCSDLNILDSVGQLATLVVPLQCHSFNITRCV